MGEDEVLRLCLFLPVPMLSFFRIQDLPLRILQVSERGIVQPFALWQPQGHNFELLQ